MSTTNYKTENLIAGGIKTSQMPLAAGSYRRGQVLEFDTGANRYRALASGSISAVFLGETTTLENGDVDSLILGGELFGGGLVDSAGDAYTVTPEFIADAAIRGFYIKK